VSTFRQALSTQRLDDHRYYHHSRINQSLHLLSAVSFLVSYALVFTDPVAAAMVGWLIAMTSRQVGHFFFEPKGYDEVNQATHEYKEAIKVGYNLRRKVVLLTLWALAPLALWANPSLGGLIEPASDTAGFMRHVGEIWLVLGAGALLFRAAQLFVLEDLQTGLVWVAKILTDPFHDIKLYWKSPIYLVRGELIEGAPSRRAG
jgi:hypothetical protein